MNEKLMAARSRFAHRMPVAEARRVIREETDPRQYKEMLDTYVDYRVEQRYVDHWNRALTAYTDAITALAEFAPRVRQTLRSRKVDAEAAVKRHTRLYYAAERRVEDWEGRVPDAESKQAWKQARNVAIQAWRKQKPRG